MQGLLTPACIGQLVVSQMMHVTVGGDELVSAVQRQRSMAEGKKVCSLCKRTVISLPEITPDCSIFSPNNCFDVLVIYFSWTRSFCFHFLQIICILYYVKTCPIT